MASKLELRRKQILKSLEQVPISSTLQLAELSGVSSETVRKDLDALAEAGLIIKVHGGVALAGNRVGDMPFDMRAARNVEKKQRIAMACINLLAPNDSIFLESCTTSLALARALLEHEELLRSLVIVTNSFSIATVFEGGAKCKQLFFLGGWVNSKEHASRGYYTAKMLGDIHVDKSFISGAALSEALVLTSFLEDDMYFQQQAIASAREAVCMIDSTKWGQSAVFTVCAAAGLTNIVTNFDCDESMAAAIRAGGTKLLLAAP